MSDDTPPVPGPARVAEELPAGAVELELRDRLVVLEEWSTALDGAVGWLTLAVLVTALALAVLTIKARA